MWKSVRILSLFLILVFVACRKSIGVDPINQNTLFQLLPSNQTGISFSNELTYNRNFNIYRYRNFYNGGGVAIGDINNDSLPDVYFSSNMSKNKLYLNKGNFKFEDISSAAGVEGTKAWSTGVAMADVNGDGWLDIYVCNSGDIKGDNKENELFINQQNGTFKEMAASYGLNDKGYSTHAAFFDYDKDGDLDLYLLNNSYKAIGSFNLRNNIRADRDTLGGDKLLRHDITSEGQIHFTDVSTEAGIYGSLIGFGLGVTVGDVNNDGWQDIFVSNDFFERDYLYINQKNGSFNEVITDQMQCLSAASMGADMADINNDGHPDIFVTDMLPSIERRLKTKTTFEDWNKYQYNVNNGYYHQFIRNMLQLNLGDGSFSEIGRLSGVHATDWSWGALLFDMDLDGHKDIFVANGIFKDLTDQDYLNFISERSTIQNIVKDDSVDYKQLIDSIPSEAIPNAAFHNQSNLVFIDKASDWGLNTPSFSNGSAYGDLDRDGDMDLIVNNVNMPCFVYKNNSTENKQNFIKLYFNGTAKNTLAYGSQVKVFVDSQMQYLEHMPIRGFQSSMEPTLIFGLGSKSKIDSIHIRFPDQTVQVMKNISSNQTLYIDNANGTQASMNLIKPTRPLLKEVQIKGILPHSENKYSDFDRDRLLYNMISNEGPKVSIGDINGDKLEDIYIGQSSGTVKKYYLQTANGSFLTRQDKAFSSQTDFEDTGHTLVDIDNDGDLDLYVCSGGNEYTEASSNLMDRLYVNDGKGNFTLSNQILPTFKFESGSCVRHADLDNDGDQDLFVGIRNKPVYHGVPVNGYILINDGKGIYTDQTKNRAPHLLTIGMITDAQWADMNKDGQPDLVICGEYMPIKIFYNNKGQFSDFKSISPNGWWNSIQVTDLDNDADLDIIGGNHGLNSRFKATAEHPIRLYINDFDQNGTVEQFLTSYREGKEYPFSLKHDVITQIPSLKKKYLKYASFAGQTIQDFFPSSVLSKSIIDSANFLSSAVFIQEKGSFKIVELPIEAQFSIVYATFSIDLDQDHLKEIILGGNQYRTKPETGRYDASYGLVIKQLPNHQFKIVSSELSGIKIKGEIRDIKPITINKKLHLIFARNNDYPLFYTMQ